MRFTKINENEIPGGGRCKKSKLEAELTEFMKMNVKCVRVVFTELEYKSVASAQCCLSKAAERYAFPIDVFSREGKLYLMRTDMD